MMENASEKTSDRPETVGVERPGALSFLLIMFVGLTLLVCYAGGQGTNSAAAVAAIILFPALLVMYIAPCTVAHWYRHPNRAAITVLNLLLGWTALGWVAALVWAYSAPKQPELTASATKQTELATQTEAPTVRPCPFCAEPIRVAAIKCKHCGSVVAKVDNGH